MELLEKYFAELIQCVDASYLVIGIILVFLSVPDTADYAPYRKAKYFLASAFFVMFINLYLWLEIFSSQDWKALNSIIACMDISLFFLTCICFAYSFASLLDSQYINKKRMLKDFGCWILTVSISWISLWEPLVPYANYLYIISTLIFCSIVVRYMSISSLSIGRKGNSWIITSPMIICSASCSGRRKASSSCASWVSLPISLSSSESISIMPTRCISSVSISISSSLSSITAHIMARSI